MSIQNTKILHLLYFFVLCLFEAIWAGFAIFSSHVRCLSLLDTHIFDKRPLVACKVIRIPEARTYRNVESWFVLAANVKPHLQVQLCVC